MVSILMTQAMWTSPNSTASGGMPAAIFCFVYLYLSFAGAGAWSIDSMIARTRHGSAR